MPDLQQSKEVFGPLRDLATVVAIGRKMEGGKDVVSVLGARGRQLVIKNDFMCLLDGENRSLDVIREICLPEGVESLLARWAFGKRGEISGSERLFLYRPRCGHGLKALFLCLSSLANQ